MSEFEGKRYTTIVKTREVSNCITGEKQTFGNVYGVYDNKTESEVYLPNFKPVCYEDVRQKAIELNNKIKTVYVIGAGDDISAAKETLKRLELSGEHNVVCVNSIGDVPLNERAKAELGDIQEVHRITARPEMFDLPDLLYTDRGTRRKGHERPYKYHK